MIEEINFEPRRGPRKEPSTDSLGTHIRIAALFSSWTAEKATSVLQKEFSKLTDPFTKSRLPLVVRFNGTHIHVPEFNQLLFEQAHAMVDVSFETTDKLRLTGRIVDLRVDNGALAQPIGASLSCWKTKTC